LKAIGFNVVSRRDGDGTVLHAEVRAGAAVIMVASNDQPYEHPPLLGLSTGQGLYLLVEDVEMTFAHAIDAGATSVIEPERTEWGGTRARVLDLEGYEWSFGTYQPGSNY
jgi:uncharacterized glyoxalase superfamily protein PhnB